MLISVILGALFISQGNGWHLKPSLETSSYEDLNFSLSFTAVIFFWRIGWCHLQVHVGN
ncbi:hypothetical protein CIPAW_01G039900 [Carya illinoinensis]|uniref:Uncharacterized protein n=1 Tax=Carya illinoinensis TaxID=32201 RepID=A0A8T1RI08_CARIL|nr:hypothetical protein CIPAW_01G039900 [Carya illinoinensis]